MKIHLLIILALSLFATTNAQTLHSIQELQDNRQAPVQKIVASLRSKDPKIISQALLAIANRQDTGMVGIITPFLSYPSPKVRKMAAFTLGQLHDSSAAEIIFARLHEEMNSECLDALYQSFGKCGTQKDLERLIFQSSISDGAQLWFISKAIARFANRRISDSAAIAFLYNAIASEHYSEWTVYALMRSNVRSINSEQEKLLSKLLENTNPDIRMWTASILAAGKSERTQEKLAHTALYDTDWRVRVNAIRSLQRNYSSQVAKNIFGLISDKNEHVSLTASEVFLQFVQRYQAPFDTSEAIRIFLDSTTFSSRQRGKVAIILLSAKNNFITSAIHKNAFKDFDEQLQASIIDGIGASFSTSLFPIVFSALKSPSSLVVMSAITAYGNIVLRFPEQRDSFLVQTLPLFSKKDAGISYTLASILQDTIFTMEYLNPHLSVLHFAFSEMKSPDDLEPMIEMIHLFVSHKDTASIPLLKNLLSNDDAMVRKEVAAALQQLTGEKFSPDGTFEIAAHRFTTAENMKYSGAIINTTKGNITIHFAQEAAPYSIASFISLCKKKFYDGLSFHRVVSNFVIQGGDPIGNGSGGPGYALRTEIYPDAEYVRGTVGLASAGKDTEGSQFFITHCPTPHLDGRYTIFAYTKDYLTVDAIMVGDRILRITLILKK